MPSTSSSVRAPRPTPSGSICRSSRSSARRPAPGIGKKIAQRIILELKDKLAKEQTSFSSDGPVPVIAAGGANKAGEASAALAVLGYGTPEIAAALKGVDMEQPLEEIIRQALKKMVR